MNNSFLAWFVIAVVLSWAMGAYNRLVRLRAKGLLAFSVLEQSLGQQIQLIADNFQEETLRVEDAPKDWQGLLESSSAVNAALKIAHSQPFNSPAATVLKDGIESMTHYWRLLVTLPPDLAGSFLPPSFQVQWEQLTFQVERARSEFNQSVINYNEAKNQFPANLLAKIFGFKPAQPV